MGAGLVREVAFSDGEGVDFNDLNNAQRFDRAYLNDLVLGSLLRSFEGDLEGATDRLYAIGVGGAPQPSATVLQVQNLKGLILQRTVATGPTGADAIVLPYYLDTNELQTTLAAGDPVNPRYDLICVQLAQVVGSSTQRDFKDATSGLLSSAFFSIRRDVTLTKQVVQGTPAATPVEPAVPAGYVKWATVLVPANFNGVFNLLGDNFQAIFDQRCPIPGAGSTIVSGHQMVLGSGWTAQPDGSILASGAGKIAYALFPGTPRQARLGHIRMYGTISAGSGAIQLVQRDLEALSDAVMETLAATMAGVANFDLTWPHRPRWSNGLSGINPGSADSTGNFFTAAIKFVSAAANDKVNYVRFGFVG